MLLYVLIIKLLWSVDNIVNNLHFVCTTRVVVQAKCRYVQASVCTCLHACICFCMGAEIFDCAWWVVRKREAVQSVHLIEKTVCRDRKFLRSLCKKIHCQCRMVQMAV